MGDAPIRDPGFVDRNRRMFSTPPDAIQFLNSLVEAISSRWNIREGSQIVPEGALEGEPRHIFLETEVLSIDGIKFGRVDYAALRDMGDRSCEFLVSTIPFFGRLGGRNDPDEVTTCIVDMARVLADNGVGVLMTPSFYRTIRTEQLAELLSTEGVHVIGLVNTPPRFLLPHTPLQPMFVVVSRQASSATFVLDCRNLKDMVLNIAGSLNHVDTGDLRTGIEVDLSSFQGFEHWYAQREIEALEGDYTKYERFSLSDVSMFINLARIGEEFEDLPHSIYLPLIGNGNAVTSLAKTTKHQSYCQIVVDMSRATPEFLCNFLNAPRFRLYLEAEKSTRNKITPKLNREQVRSLPVALPDLETQHKISHNIEKLAALRSMVDELAQNISVNPMSSSSMTQQVDEALAVFGRLSTAGHLYSLLLQGESKTVEFKQTFSLDASDNTKKSFLEDMVIKTIAAFLNSNGGDLLVGINDEGQVAGIEFEIEKLHRGSRDNFLKHFKNILKSRIGEEFYPIIAYDTVELDGKLVFHVNCHPSDNEVFVDSKDFYVRTNPATDKLEGPKLTAYVRQRFYRPPVAVLG